MHSNPGSSKQVVVVGGGANPYAPVSFRPRGARPLVTFRFRLWNRGSRKAARGVLVAPQLSRDEAEAILEHVGHDDAALQTICRCSTLGVSWRLAGTTAMANLARKRFSCVLVLEKTLPAFDHRTFVRKQLVPIGKLEEEPVEIRVSR